MHWKPHLCVGILILFLAISCSLAYAEGGYEVVIGPPPGNVSPNGGAAAGYEIVLTPHPDDISATGGADGDLTFWDLPLWIQIAIISGAIGGLSFSLLGIAKIIPFIIAKIADVLENQNRRRIYTYVEKNPGCTTAEISRNESLNLGTVKHHTSMLERSARITTEKIGRYVRLFKRSDDYSEREKRLIAAMKSETGRMILIIIRDNSGITNARLSEMLGIPEGTVHWHTSRYIRDRIVIAEKKMKLKELYIQNDLKPALDMIIASGQD
ncbi:conserved hypothetical protein [Methanocella arvoryzae MRE50]|uniref:HVO-0163 N-terminal HTH domain-containing protein n=1 Tax=Methanocella arvoryzae (strain DSM 22066 / NBRC 105507 / MRE50) TaxID=351160 RepID=Q0W603_METAR|nr:conserved hypothetical protein [Methanocella arvoryzae MRE50]